MAKHSRVNKFNLESHVQTFAFLHNMRKQDDYSKFTKIISVLYLATKFYIKSERNTFGPRNFQTFRQQRSYWPMPLRTITTKEFTQP